MRALLIWIAFSLLVPVGALSAEGTTQVRKLVIKKRIYKKPANIAVKEEKDREVKLPEEASLPPEEPVKGRIEVAAEAQVLPSLPETAKEKTKQEESRLFVEVASGVNYLERTVTIETKNTGQTIMVGDNVVYANGIDYAIVDKETQVPLEISIGMAYAPNHFYRVSYLMMEDIGEWSVTAALPLSDQLSGWWGVWPYLSGSIGIGYSDFDEFTPDSVSVGVFSGVVRELEGNWQINGSLGYMQRFWRTVEGTYGDETWRDGEVRLRIGARYCF